LFSFKDEEDIYTSKALKSHGAAVINTVGIAVAGLRDFESLVPLLQVLGRRHIGLGLTPEHFDVIGAELIRTLGSYSILFYMYFKTLQL
jgi:hemoglobin-like flavoprotein